MTLTLLTSTRDAFEPEYITIKQHCPQSSTLSPIVELTPNPHSLLLFIIAPSPHITLLWISIFAP